MLMADSFQLKIIMYLPLQFGELTNENDPSTWHSVCLESAVVYPGKHE